MTVAGETLIRRTTLILRDRVIESVFYAVFPPDGHAAQVLHRPRGTGRPR
jgi:peroxiredoxin